MKTLNVYTWIIAAMACVPFAQAQTWTAELDPDFYFDRGITLAVGAKPSADSRWTILGDFASRKIGPLRDDRRMTLRLGGGLRYRLAGQRGGPFVQVNGSADQVRYSGVHSWHGSVRPGLGFQWFPWKTRPFYVAPLAAVEDPPGPPARRPRFELRIGWQF